MSPTRCLAAHKVSSKFPKWPGEWWQGPSALGARGRTPNLASRLIHSFASSFSPIILSAFIPPLTWTEVIFIEDASQSPHNSLFGRLRE